MRLLAPGLARHHVNNMMNRTALVGMVSQEVSLTHAELRLNPDTDHLLEERGIFKSSEMLKGLRVIFVLFLLSFSRS